MPSTKNESVVVTGCGWVTPFASGTIDEVLAAAPAAQLASPPAGGYWAVPESLRQGSSGLSDEIQADKGAWVAAIALEVATRESGLKRDGYRLNG